MKLIKTLGIGTIVSAVIVGIVLFILMKVSAFIVIAYALPKFTADFTTHGGLNHWLAQALAVAFTACTIIGYFLISRFSKSFGGKAINLVILLLLVIGGYSLTVYWLQSRHIESNQKVKESWNTSQVTKFARVTVGQDTAFFDPVTGKPLVWYYQDDKNRLEFFTSDGFHPQYNQPLKPVDAPTVKQALAHIDQGKTEMFIGATKPKVLAIAPTPPPLSLHKPPVANQHKQNKQNKQSKQTVKPVSEPEKPPFLHVARQQMSDELGSMVTYLCQAQKTQ